MWIFPLVEFPHELGVTEDHDEGYRSTGESAEEERVLMLIPIEKSDVDKRT